jgi:hypothetical protein
MKNIGILLLVAFALVSTSCAPAKKPVSKADICPESASEYSIDIYHRDLAFNGTTAFVETKNEAKPHIIEIDMNGKVIWDYKIPSKIVGGPRHAGLGADIEWLPEKDHFLFVMPLRGVYEVNRHKEIVWQYETRKISHDADRLPNGNTLFVFGQSDTRSDAQVTEVDPAGNIVWQWFGKDHLKDVGGPHTSEGGFCHTNSVIRLPNSNTMISLRNFHMLVEVNKAGEIVWSLRELKNGKILKFVHDPEILPNGNIMLSVHRPQVLIEVTRDGEVGNFFKRPDIKLVRNNHRLPNGNTRIVDCVKIIELSPTNEIVWRCTKRGVDTIGWPDRNNMRWTGGQLLKFFYKAAYLPAWKAKGDAAH